MHKEEQELCSKCRLHKDKNIYRDMYMYDSNGNESIEKEYTRSIIICSVKGRKPSLISSSAFKGFQSLFDTEGNGEELRVNFLKKLIFMGGSGNGFYCGYMEEANEH
jgi:hypothetical protein